MVLGGLVVIAPARRAGDLGSIPGPSENFFFLKNAFYCFLELMSFLVGYVLQIIILKSYINTFNGYMYVCIYLVFRITIWQVDINNLREKFSPEPGFEPGSPALRAGAITTKPPRRSTWPSRNSSLIETRVRILVKARIFSLKLLIYELPDGYSDS